MKKVKMFAVFSMLSLTLSGVAQKSAILQRHSVVTKAPEAVAALQAAVTALGGSSVIGSQQSWRISATIQYSEPNKPAGQVTWQSAGGEIRAEGSSGQHTWTFITGHGNPQQIDEKRTVRKAWKTLRASFIPVLVGPMLLQEITDSSRSIRLEHDLSLPTGDVLVVRTRLQGEGSMGSDHVWYIDRKSYLPIRLHYEIQAEYPTNIFINASYAFSDYRNVSGVMYPFTVISANSNQLPLLVLTTKSINPNAVIAQSIFDVLGASN